MPNFYLTNSYIKRHFGITILIKFESPLKSKKLGLKRVINGINFYYEKFYYKKLLNLKFKFKKKVII